MLLTQLTDISIIQGKENFSGTVRYEKTFTLDKPADRILIELEEAYESIRVYLNDKLVGRK